VDFALKNKDTFVGLDMANDELIYSCKPFVELFQLAKKNGLHITVHAGESVEDIRFAHNVRDAIELLGAERIGHGVASILDSQVMDLIKMKGIVLESCPTSNYLIGVVKTVSDHPVRKFIDAGLKVTLSTDDPGVFNINLSQEYAILQSEQAFTLEDLKRCNDCALLASFIPVEEKRQYFPDYPHS